MHILCLGLNHRTAPLELRERLAYSDDATRSALARLGCSGYAGVSEMVILSTCNRIELYAVTENLDFQALEEFLADTHSLDAGKFRSCLYRHADADVVHHLLNVAAGMDSQVLGEPQILGQVTKALELARGQDTAGLLLNRLFQAAIHAGKRAHTETAISRNPASVSSLAAGLCERMVKELQDAQVVILGAGEMAELAVEALRKRGVQKILVVNRTLARARRLSEKWAAEVSTFEALESALVRADILVTSTGAPHTILQAGMVAFAMDRRPHRPLVLIDIAVPHDIDPAAAVIPGVSLYDIDHLNARLESSLEIRSREAPLVEAILDQEERAFLDFLGSLDMLPIIANMRMQAESIRQAELEKTLRHLPSLTEAERERIEALTRALVKKLLHGPTHRLHAEATCPHAPEYATVARTLFGLEEENGLCGFSGSACPLSPAD